MDGVLRPGEGSMTRLSLAVGCVLFAAAQPVPRASDTEEAATIRRDSEKYAAAVCKKDAAALGRLLADDYSQCSFQLPDGDKKGAIRYFTEPQRTFVSFKTAGVRVRLHGDTAVETGEVHASGTEYGGNFI